MARYLNRGLGIWITIVAASLGGCATTNGTVARNFEPARPPQVTPPPSSNGSLYQTGFGMTLFEDMRARHVGDVLTVIVAEKTDATKKASTSTKKDDAVTMRNPTLFGLSPNFDVPRPFMPALRNLSLETSIDASREFAGEGDSAQKNSLSGRVTVTVTEVLPNGNLVVRGQKRVTINQGDELVQLAGIVRAVDIRPDNTVLSTNIADMTVAYVGEGALADANAQGWLSRVFSGKWWPF